MLTPVLILLVLLSATSAQIDYRLPGDFTPISYVVSVYPHIENFDDGNFIYDGHVSVVTEAVLDNVDTVTLHSHETINITKVIYLQEEITNTVRFDAETEKLSITLPKALSKGERAELDIDYTGLNQDDQAGFYRTFYDDPQKGNRWLVSTNFKPTMARKAFPCFDEPQIKSHYQIIVSISPEMYEEGYTALSITDPIVITNTSRVTTYVFNQTILPISSYMVGFFVSDYQIIPPITFNSSGPTQDEGIKTMYTYCQPQYANHQGRLVTLFGAGVVEYFTKLLGVGYLPQNLYQVGTSEVFGDLAHFGMINYGEYIISNTDFSPVMTALTSELSRQWFGGVVSPSWWSWNWLDEGFSRYFHIHATEEIQIPGWNGPDSNEVYNFLIDLVFDLYTMDTYNVTLPLSYPVNSPADIRYDEIVTYKAAAILRMWRHILGEQTFKKALNIYLTNNTVTTPDNFASALDAVADESLGTLAAHKPSELFRVWHEQSGFPILQVTRPENLEGPWVIRQEVYIPVEGRQEDKPRWNIPITFTTEQDRNFENTEAKLWLTENNTQIELYIDETDWIIVDLQWTTYTKINFDNTTWEKLLDVVTNEAWTIHKYNRIQLIHNFFFFLDSPNDNNAQHSTLPKIMKYLEKETNFLPWKVIFHHLKFYKDMLQEEEKEWLLLKSFVLSILEPHYQRLGTKSRKEDTEDDVNLRSEVTSWLCKLHHESCQLEPSKLQLSLLEETLKIGGKVKPKDGLKVFKDILEEHGNAKALLNFLAENMEAIAANYPGWNPFGNMLTSVAKSLNSEHDLDTLLKMTRAMEVSKDMKLKRALQDMKIAQQLVRTNLSWMNVKRPLFVQWLENHF